MNLLHTNKAVFSPTQLPPGLLYRLLSSTRIASSLPAALENILTYVERPRSAPRDDQLQELSLNLTDILSTSAKYITAFHQFLSECVPVIRASPAHSTQLRALLTSSLDASHLADLLFALQGLLEASLAHRLPCISHPSVFAMYSGGLAQVLGLYEDPEGVDIALSNNFIKRIMTSGTWVTPIFAGIEQRIASLEDGFSNMSNNIAIVMVMTNILVMPVYFDAQELDWHAWAKTTKVLADPTFQQKAMDILDRVEMCVKNAEYPIDGTPGIAGIAQSLQCGGLMLPLAGYGLIIEGTRAQALISKVPFEWSSMTRALTKIVDWWVKLATTIVSPRYVRKSLAATVLFRAINPFPSERNYASADDISGMSAEKVVSLLHLVERLVTVVATSQALVSSLDTEEFEMPVRPALELATHLSEKCANYIIREKAQGLWNKKVGGAALAALETVGKTGQVLLAVNPAVRARFLRIPDDIASEELQNDYEDKHDGAADVDKWWLTRLNNIMPPLMQILEKCTATGGMEEEQQAACAVLTVGKYCLGTEAFMRHFNLKSITELLKLKTSANKILCGCVVPSDDMSLFDYMEGFEENDGEIEIENLSTIAEGADPLDPGRMKLRAQVLSHRACGYLDCTTIRPSFEERFGKICSGCKIVRYCCAEHQKLDWKKVHKIGCKELQKNQ